LAAPGLDGITGAAGCRPTSRGSASPRRSPGWRSWWTTRGAAALRRRPARRSQTPRSRPPRRRAAAAGV